MSVTVSPDAHPIADDRARRDPGAATDLSLPADDRAGFHGHVLCQPGGRMDGRLAQTRHGGFRQHGLGVEVLQCERKSPVGLRHQERRHAGGNAGSESRRHDTRGCLRHSELTQVLAVVQERKVAGTRLGERLDVMDEHCRLGGKCKLTTNLLCQCRKRQGCRPLKEAGMLHDDATTPSCAAVRLVPGPCAFTLAATLASPTTAVLRRA
jgi:hypothetical protein